MVHVILPISLLTCKHNDAQRGRQRFSTNNARIAPDQQPPPCNDDNRRPNRCFDQFLVCAVPRNPICCGKEDCENMVSWLAMKSRLESRLILSAGMSLVVLVDAFLRSLLEVGQALLQRHKAYVRQLEVSVPWISFVLTNWNKLAEESWMDAIYFQPETCQ